MLSSHIPEFSGGEVEVVGEAIVEHGLREVQAFVPAFKTSNFVADEEGKVSHYALTPTKEVIRVEKTGANEGVLGDNPVIISWMALGR